MEAQFGGGSSSNRWNYPFLQYLHSSLHFGHADHRQQLPVAFAEIAHGFPPPHRYAGARTLKAEPAPPSRPAWIHPDTERAPWFEHCE